MKGVPHGHTNLGKGTKVEAQAGEQVGQEKKTIVQRDHTRKPNWLWHYLGNPSFLSEVTLKIVLLLQNQSRSYQVKKDSLTDLLSVGGNPCPPTPREISSGKKAPTCLDGAVGSKPQAGPSQGCSAG